MAFKYLLASASGSGSGSDWTNAFTTLADANDGVARGDRLYVGEGEYAEDITFDVPASGTSTIEIRKATVADHGTNTGWNNTFANQATIQGSCAFATDYWILNGARRDEDDWFDPTAYGFRITGSIYSWPINFPPGGNHLVFQYLDIGADVGSVYPDISGPPFYFVGNGTTQFDFTVSRCHMHNCGIVMLVDVDGITIEYSAFADSWGKEAIRGFGTCTNGILRYLKFLNTTRDTGLPGEEGTAPIAIWDSNNAGSLDNWQIYAIEMLDTEAIEHSGGAIVVGGDGGGWVGVPANNVKVYNVTIAGFNSNISANILLNGTGNEVVNTVWYDCIGTPSATPNTASNGEESSDPFVDYAGGDLRLASELLGTELESPYNVDLDGNIRGQNGSFSRGAYQYIPEAPVGADHLILNQTINTEPVTEVWRRAEVVGGVAGAFSYYVLHHAGNYPSQPLNNFAYARFGTPQDHVYVFEGTVSEAEVIASIP